MKIDFEKGNGLVPTVIQDYSSMKVLMVGYMNKEALQKTTSEKKVTFFSRSRKRLWTKGETSGNFLNVIEIKTDCDSDSLLIKVVPEGPVCHKGDFSCFREEGAKGFLYSLEEIINQRIKDNVDDSYTNRLFREGINRIARKVGEEAVELVIEAKDNDEESFKNEAADLLYHFLVLLKAKNTCLADIEATLSKRHDTTR
jgi:phosphoribosyl-ATP pyrophosphohydrolase/phosphoribosyl-AMP cyclohydrolase